MLPQTAVQHNIAQRWDCYILRDSGSISRALLSAHVPVQLSVCCCHALAGAIHPVQTTPFSASRHRFPHRHAYMTRNPTHLHVDTDAQTLLADTPTHAGHRHRNPYRATAYRGSVRSRRPLPRWLIADASVRRTAALLGRHTRDVVSRTGSATRPGYSLTRSWSCASARAHRDDAMHDASHPISSHRPNP